MDANADNAHKTMDYQNGLFIIKLYFLSIVDPTLSEYLMMCEIFQLTTSPKAITNL